MRLSVTGSGSEHGIRLTSQALGPVRLDRLAMAMAMAMTFDADVAPPGVLLFYRVRCGRLGIDPISCAGSDTRRQRRYLPGEVALSAQPEQPYRALVADADIDVAVIDPAQVARVAQGAPGRSQAPVHFTGYEPISVVAGRQWARTYALAHDLGTNTDLRAAPLVVAMAAQLLVATTLASFPNTALTDPTVEDRHDAHPDTLRRAVAFIEANPHRDISVADIAAVAYMTVRAVQLAFRRHLDTTPWATCGGSGCTAPTRSCSPPTTPGPR